MGGCLIEEEYQEFTGGTGTSISMYDARIGSWQRIWTDGGLGRFLVFLSSITTPEQMRMTGGERLRRGGGIERNRTTWINQADGTVLQFTEVSTDQGQSWQVTFTGVYVRAGG